tara:strand:- start:5783 stop:7078 length:1296 start_codon:yes stop_codon:yes gene_type:complete
VNISQSDSEGYFFANRSLSGVSLAATLLATQVGGGMLIGIGDMAYTSGLMGYMYALGQILGLIFVLLFFSKKFQCLKLKTTSEIFTTVYQSPLLRKSASILSVISLSIILIAQAVAIKKLFVSIGFTTNMPLYILWAIVVAYTSFGGFAAVVKTDIIQIFLICSGLFLIALNLPSISITPSTVEQFIPNKSIDFGRFVNYLIWPCCYLLIEQDMVQRFGAAQNLKSIKVAIIWTLFGTFCIASVPLLIGLIAKNQSLVIADNSSVLITFVKIGFSPWLYNIILFVLLMAIVSTVDSILCAISCLISCDNLFKSKSNNSYFKNSAITITIGTLTLLGSLFASSVLKTLVFSYGLTASALFVPVSFALLGFSNSKLGACFSVIFGIFTYCILTVINDDLTIWALLASGFGFYLGMMIEKTTLTLNPLNSIKGE